MTLSFKVLGFELATISVELPVYERDEVRRCGSPPKRFSSADRVSIVDDAAKSVSRWFFDRMVR